LATPRPARSPMLMRRGAETGEEVVLIEHERLEMGGRGGGGPRAGIAFCIRKHERSCVGQFGESPLDWNTGAPAWSLADTDSPITARATPRTRDNNPNERTMTTRASGNTLARSCLHRWTRRISKGQATSQMQRISKGQATSRGGT